MGSGTAIHFGLQQTGYGLTISAFVMALLAVSAYLAQAFTKQTNSSWHTVARGAALLQIASVAGTAGLLFYLIKGHFFEFAYVYSHSSLHLEPKYMIACFWEGQEGSFLLWAFWNALLVGLLLAFRRSFPAVAFAVLMGVQAVLASMLLGIDLGFTKIGSSPFMLFREAMPSLPVLALNPDFIPKDGRGLNPLLQNYWNIIHPPTLFLGFALAGIPYALSVASLTTGASGGRDKFLRTSTLIATSVLGVGIVMGAYWAYETLNFGGYWNWDPVENAVYVPWLFLAASVHVLLLPRAEERPVLVHGLLQTSFLLILYSTFLTRSGVLGETSVHSFTDLGLSGQLLFFLLFFAVLSIGLLIRASRRSSTNRKESVAELLLLSGIALLCLASFQVLLTTSIPVFNSISKAFGVDAHLAPPADAIKHYTTWQMIFAAAIVILAALGQLFWTIGQAGRRRQILQFGGLGALLSAGVVLLATPVNRWQDIAFLIACVFALTLNLGILAARWGGTWRTKGGTIAHVGLALMLLGILFSAGYSKVLSLNRSGLVYRKEFSEEMNENNVLLWRSKPVEMPPYSVTYLGRRTELASPAAGALVDPDSLRQLHDKYTYLATGDLLTSSGNRVGKRGDTVSIRPENTYYQVAFTPKDTTQGFTLYPRAQTNPSMGLLASPDIRMYADRDIYSHVSSIPAPNQEVEWSKPQVNHVRLGETFFAKDYVSVLEDIRPLPTTQGSDYAGLDVVVQATVAIRGPHGRRLARPLFLIRGQEVASLPSVINELGIRVALTRIDPANGSFHITIETAQQDWVILKAVEKPFIGLFWTGFLIVTAGFVISLFKGGGKGQKTTHVTAAFMPAEVAV